MAILVESWAFDSVFCISDSASENCTSLKSIEIPESINCNNKSSFNNCNSLRRITVDPENKSYCDVDGVLFNKDKTMLVKFPKNKNVLYYHVPDTVVVIEDHAFVDCELNCIKTPKKSIGMDCEFLLDIKQKLLLKIIIRFMIPV